jgi:hypothetical protein
MAHSVRRLIAAGVFAAGIWSIASAASATPVADALAIKNAAPAAVESVQWRRGWGGGWGWRGRGWGWGGAAAGFVAGAVVGSAIAAGPYYYGYGPYYPGPYYAAPPVAYGPPAPGYGYGPPSAAYGAPVAGDPAAYCAQRFKSYDPATGTYLGYDGVRHPCP